MKKIVLFICAFATLVGTAEAQVTDTVFFNMDFWVFEHAYPVDTVGYGHPSYLFNEPHELTLPVGFNPNEDNPYQKNRKDADAGLLAGMNFDAEV